MTEQERQKLLARMADAAALPPGDPERRRLAPLIAADEALTREWLEILAREERLRLELARVDLPPGLEHRLLSISGHASMPPRRSSRARRWAMGMVAALAVLLAGWMVLLALQRHSKARALAIVAEAAAAGRQLPGKAVLSSDWETMSRRLSGRVPFIIDRPRITGTLQLMGGATVMLAGKPAICTCWHDGKQTCWLYEFCGKDFGLPHGRIRRQAILVPSGGGLPACRVVIWSEGHCDYALAMEPAPDESSA